MQLNIIGFTLIAKSFYTESLLCFIRTQEQHLESLHHLPQKKKELLIKLKLLCLEGITFQHQLESSEGDINHPAMRKRKNEQINRLKKSLNL